MRVLSVVCFLLGGFLATEAQFLVVNGFSGSDCTGALVLSVAVETGNAALGNLTCKRVKCGAVPVPSAFEAGGGLKVGLSYSVLCVTSMPAVALPLVATVWAGSTVCGGDPNLVAGVRTDICVPSGTSASQRQSCSGELFIVQRWLESGNCASEPTVTSTTGNGGCVVSGTDSIMYGCNTASCFHESTTFDLAGGREMMTMKDLRNGTSDQCTVPHTVVSSGVRIVTACTTKQALRVTRDHLVYVRRSKRKEIMLIEAGKVVVGDELVSSDTPALFCRVVAVENEHGQSYSGLNCLDSTVGANGFLVSTFGTYHLVPSVWMRVVGSLVGVKQASAAGEAIARRLMTWGFL